MAIVMLMNTFEKGQSKFKVKGQWLTFMIQVNDQQLIFDDRAKF